MISSEESEISARRFPPEMRSETFQKGNSNGPH